MATPRRRKSGTFPARTSLTSASSRAVATSEATRFITSCPPAAPAGRGGNAIARSNAGGDCSDAGAVVASVVGEVAGLVVAPFGAGAIHFVYDTGPANVPHCF